jgi:hypothetical protein
MQLYHVRDLNDPLASIIKDDPVRAHIPLEQRINENAEILVLKEGEKVLAATCLQWLKEVPEDEQDLQDLEKTHDVAVFYTIWSYSPGAGAKLIKQAASWILEAVEECKTIVTLSPQTDMARKFHLNNGATIRKENSTSVNYQYYSKD